MTTTLAPVRPPLPIAVRRLAAAECDVLAAFARDLGLTVAEEHHAVTPRYIVTAPSGKDAVLTIAGHDHPAPVVMWLHPPRHSAMAPRAALLSMRVATSTPDLPGPS